MAEDNIYKAGLPVQCQSPPPNPAPSHTQNAEWRRAHPHLSVPWQDVMKTPRGGWTLWIPLLKGKLLSVLKLPAYLTRDNCPPVRAVLPSQPQGTMLAATTLAPGCLGQQPETNEQESPSPSTIPNAQRPEGLVS